MKYICKVPLGCTEWFERQAVIFQKPIIYIILLKKQNETVLVYNLICQLADIKSDGFLNFWIFDSLPSHVPSRTSVSL